MSVKRTKSDGFMLRLPPGLRDRVKAHAELNGRSMNTEIVRVLEEEFPEPHNLVDRLEDLHILTNALRRAATVEGVDELTEKIRQLVQAIADGTVPNVDEDTRKDVEVAFQTWDLYENLYARRKPSIGD